MAISNDSEFKTALATLSVARQRQVGALFVESVLDLGADPRVKGALNAAKRPDITDEEIEAMLHAVKSASVESYTKCGREADWQCQAGHFVAEAAVACMVTEAAGTHKHPAWNAAMHARMARTCHSIATGDGTENDETARQYQLLDDYLQGQAS